MNKTIAKAIMIFLISAFVLAHYFLVNQALMTKSDLKEVSGFIYSQQLERVSGKGNYKAFVLGVSNESILFSVHEKYDRAFEFLERNLVIGKSISLFYDPNGFNGFSYNKTAHVFEITIDEYKILNIEEATSLEKNMLIILLIIDLIICLFIFVKRKIIFPLKRN